MRDMNGMKKKKSPNCLKKKLPDRPGPGKVPSIEENESRIVETIFAHENNWNVVLF